MSAPGRTGEQLIAGALAAPFSRWDFSYLQGRMATSDLCWDYNTLVRRKLPAVQAVLDLGTGGGKLLATFAPFPSRTVVAEAYAPNVAIARARLAPLGVDVVQVAGAPDNLRIASGAGLGSLPFAGMSFPLVINRHESYYPVEVHRVLEPGGTFLTQQVGGAHYQELNRLLGAPELPSAWNLNFAVRQMEEAGFDVVAQGEQFPETTFTDIGAVVYYLKAVPWQMPGFSADTCMDRLVALHARITSQGDLRVQGHYFYLEAVKR